VSAAFDLASPETLDLILIGRSSFWGGRLFWLRMGEWLGEEATEDKAAVWEVLNVDDENL
jgi:hypothetical protein